MMPWFMPAKSITSNPHTINGLQKISNRVHGVGWPVQLRPVRLAIVPFERVEIMNRWEFQVVLSGDGETKEQAWRDACEAFSLEPGDCPDDYLCCEYKEGEKDGG